jgi:hypothetical protein
MQPDAPRAGRSAFIPALLVSLAFVGWLVFQSVELVTERRQLVAALGSLEAGEQSASALRASLDAVATATAELATAGNGNARTIVEELRKRGVTINPAATSRSP